MRTIEELWHEIFDRDPSPGEVHAMEGIAAVVEPESAAFVQCAVTVHTLYRVLLLDPSSPVRMTVQIAKVLKDLEGSAGHIGTTLQDSFRRVSALKNDAEFTLLALQEAREFAAWQRSNRVTVFRRDRAPEKAEYSVSLDILGLLAGIVLLAVILGGTIVIGLALMIMSSF